MEDDNGQYVTCDADKAEQLNSYFSSVSVQDDSRNPAFKRRVADEVKIRHCPVQSSKTTQNLQEIKL